MWKRRTPRQRNGIREFGVKGAGSALREPGGDKVARTLFPDADRSGLPRRVPVPDLPSLPVQVPSPPPFSVQFPPQVSSFGRNFESPQAPKLSRTRYERWPYDQVRESRRRRGYRGGNSLGVLKTRIASADAAEDKRTAHESDMMRDRIRSVKYL